jgi:hypothetical protein
VVLCNRGAKVGNDLSKLQVFKKIKNPKKAFFCHKMAKKQLNTGNFEPKMG